MFLQDGYVFVCIAALIAEGANGINNAAVFPTAECFGADPNEVGDFGNGIGGVVVHVIIVLYFCPFVS